MDTVIQLSLIRDEKKRKEEQKQKEWRRSGYRLLWNKEVSMASHQYHCDYCIAPIDPGEEYIREVYANYYNLWVKRRH